MKTIDDGKSVSLPPPRRHHDSATSRRALPEAAARLFRERGYDSTTAREIGERVRVDPALIARYFDSKEGLYLAAVAETPSAQPTGNPVELLQRVLQMREAGKTGGMLETCGSAGKGVYLPGSENSQVSSMAGAPTPAGKVHPCQKL
jgi:hypothetical protein